MRKINSIIFAFLILAGCTVQPTPTPIPTLANIQPSLALTHARLIDGTGAAPILDAVVLIGQGKLIAVGTRSQVAIPPGVPTLNLEGRTVMPGVINAHVHGGFNESRLENWAQNGVLGVCDMAVMSTDYAPLFAFRDAALVNTKFARLAAAGPMLTVPGGYPIAHWGGKGLTASSVEEAIRFTQILLDAGADYIKIPLESGSIFRQVMPMHSAAQAKAIVETAHKRQAIVVAHISISTDLEKALDAGVDVLAHMSTDRVPDALMQRVVSSGAIWIPTLELWEKVAPFAERVEENLKRFVAAGGTVALGTDFLGAPDITFDEGMPIFEITRMRASGMTPMQIIVAATRNAARACHLEQLTGTLQPGKSADLIVMDGNPLDNLSALQQLHLVMRAGVVIKNRP